MKVCIVTPVYRAAEPLASELASLGHTLHVVHGTASNPFAAPARLVRTLGRRPALVHVIGSEPWAIGSGLAVARLLRSPLVLQFQEPLPDPSRIRNRAIRAAGAVITATQEIEKQAGRLGARLNDLFVIPPWPKFVAGSHAWIELAMRYESVYKYTLAERSVATQLTIGGIDGSITA